ncbi:MAG TPA: SH3 domain-containing protein [Oxalicibacterium sp.]|nr:SH3 domain-containing protein [Oxalicibacterium sp.]
MKKRDLLLIVVLSSATLGAAAAHAAQYKSVGANPVVAYNAPSEKARKVYVAPRGMPVEIILTQNGWSKVRDAVGDLFWLEAKGLAGKRTVIVIAPSAKLHASATDASPLVAVVDKGVLLDLAAAPAAGWVKLTHRDGTTGFAKVGEVWGE